VELIVVVTIIAILGAVGFVAYSNYLTDARDSNRISQMSKLASSLQAYGTRKSLPLPDNKINITASGQIVAYQGVAGVDVLGALDFTNGGKDPKDGTYFTYHVNSARNKMQLLSFMEGAQTLSAEMPQAYASDYENRYPSVY
jgi:type II secretory pathway pseudopilin PulG